VTATDATVPAIGNATEAWVTGLNRAAGVQQAGDGTVVTTAVRYA